MKQSTSKFKVGQRVRLTQSAKDTFIGAASHGRSGYETGVVTSIRCHEPNCVRVKPDGRVEASRYSENFWEPEGSKVVIPESGSVAANDNLF